MTLFSELKAATKLAHDDLEKNLDLLSPSITRDDYLNILKKFYGVYAPIETHVENSELASYFEDRYKLQLLIKDLRAFGLSDTEIEELPLHKDFLKIPSVDSLLGTLYVLEGSSLGSLILSKHFASRFSLTSLNGLAFFTAYGDKTMLRWQEWKGISERLEEEWKLNRCDVLKSANETFSELRIWMCS